MTRRDKPRICGPCRKCVEAVKKAGNDLADAVHDMEELEARVAELNRELIRAYKFTIKWSFEAICEDCLSEGHDCGSEQCKEFRVEVLAFMNRLNPEEKNALRRK